MRTQTTLAAPVRVSGVGLHTGRRAIVTLSPAPADHGRVVEVPGGRAVPIAWTNWVPSQMSTSVALGGGRSLRTVEHLMAALSAHRIDNVRIAVDGPEVPIFDGSAARWCRVLREAGTRTLDAPAQAIRVRRPVQVARDGGFLRIEPADRFAVDVTHDLLPAFPVMRWRGAVEGRIFDAELARSRSFGNLHRRLGLVPPSADRPDGRSSVVANRIDPGLPLAAWAATATPGADAPAAPLLRGWRPWRATLVAGAWMIPPRRYPDEPVRHVALDMIGDLALAGAPLLGRVVAHNPSHEKTHAIVAALMSEPANWEWGAAPAVGV